MYVLRITGFLTLSSIWYAKEHNTETASFQNVMFFRILDGAKVQKPTIPECYTPSAKPFRIYLYMRLTRMLILVHCRNCLLKEDIVIAENTNVGENSHISHSVIGKNCHIGRNVTISNSYIWDNVTVGVRQMC